MKRIVSMAAAIVLSLAALPFTAMSQDQQAAIATTNLKVGDAAPDFTLPSDQKGSVTLSSFKGKKNVILAFYVLAFTGGWTKELQAYQADLAKIEASDSVVFGISIDSMPANGAFAKQIGVTFPLLSDMNRKVLTAYGILQKYPAGGDTYEFARRTTFVIDKNGIIKHIDFDSTAIDPTTAVTMCTGLNEKHGN